MASKKSLWRISNRPSTKAKLSILKKCFEMWLTIWNKQNWIGNEMYIMDLFAGKGNYIDDKNFVSGSPLIFLETIVNKKQHLEIKERKLILYFIEKRKGNFRELNKNINLFIENNPSLNKIAEVRLINDDCNIAINKIISSIKTVETNPLFVLIDPTGLQIKHSTMENIVGLKNPKDILFNYIIEGVNRTSGIAKKENLGAKLNPKELKTLETLQEFIGNDIDVINSTNREILLDYIDIFTSKNLNVIGYDMRYPDRNDILYYLLFAVKNTNVAEIVKKIYAKQKEEQYGPTLFGGKDFYINGIFTAYPQIKEINRKTLLYKTKVEYGDWTINHIIGCAHGCNYPCYAMMMAKKFGWVKNYAEWRIPKITKNYLSLLEKEIPKYKNQIKFVHLCFMSDPFMYDSERNGLILPIKEMTLNIIEKLNREDIRVTTLTKGIYPDDILDRSKFSPENEYGITLVSLSDEFKRNFEPYSAPYIERIKSLYKLAKNNLNTWVSIEPYPIPALDKTATNIEKILEKISFVKKIIFGKLNYRKLSDYNGESLKIWKNNDEFYEEITGKVLDFCHKKGIQYHIKSGTPLSKSNTKSIFRDKPK